MGKLRSKEVAVLKLPDGTYAYIKSLSRLLGAQISKTDHSRYVCIRCLKDFPAGLEEIIPHVCGGLDVIPKHLKPIKKTEEVQRGSPRRPDRRWYKEVGCDCGSDEE